MVTWRPDSERAPSGRFNISMTLLNTRLLQVQVKPKGAPVLVDSVCVDGKILKRVHQRQRGSVPGTSE